MKFTKNEVKIGLTIIVALIIAVLGFRFMRRIPLFQSSINLVSVFPQVNGLTAGKPVMINGVGVGAVKSVLLLPSDSVQVILNINNQLHISSDSKAYITTIDLLGDKAVVIKEGTSARSLGDGDRIAGVYSEGTFGKISSAGLSISKKVAQVSSNVDVLVQNLNHIFTKSTGQDLNGMLSNLQQSSKQLNEILKKKNHDIQASITHIRNILGTVDTLSADNRQKLDSLLTNLQQSSKNLNHMSGQLNQASGQLNQILTKINSGRGTLGRLVNDDDLYRNLDSLSYRLQKTLTHFEKHPQDYLRYITIKLF